MLDAGRKGDRYRAGVSKVGIELRVFDNDKIIRGIDLRQITHLGGSYLRHTSVRRFNEQRDAALSLIALEASPKSFLAGESPVDPADIDTVQAGEDRNRYVVEPDNAVGSVATATEYLHIVAIIFVIVISQDQFVPVDDRRAGSRCRQRIELFSRLPCTRDGQLAIARRIEPEFKVIGIFSLPTEQEVIFDIVQHNLAVPWTDYDERAVAVIIGAGQKTHPSVKGLGRGVVEDEIELHHPRIIALSQIQTRWLIGRAGCRIIESLGIQI